METMILTSQSKNQILDYLHNNHLVHYEIGILNEMLTALENKDSDKLNWFSKQSSVAYPTALPPNAPVGKTLFDYQFQAIITQKYISLNGLFNLEGYNEFRRTGYPVLPQNPASQDPAAVSQTLPTRIPYPISEFNTNYQNLNAQGTIDPFTSKIFWAK